MLPEINGEFGIVKAPELRFGKEGNAWLKLRAVAKDRKRGQNGEWEDGAPCYLDISIERKQAEHLVDSVTVGDSIIVSGTLAMEEWTDKEGNKRTSYVIRARKVGVSVQFGPVTTARSGAGNVVRGFFPQPEPQVETSPF
jgi:single-strand DNA-binding protein